MINNILSKIIAHRAGIMLGGAAVGVVVTSILAVKDSKNYEENIHDAECEKDSKLSDEEINEMMISQGFGEFDGNNMPAEFDYLTKKERALIFAKTYWKTGLSMAVTFGLMILSHRSMAKELAATAAALGVIGSKYDDLKKTLKEKYPKEYKKVMEMINQKNAQRKMSEKPFEKEESYDGKKRYYFPLSDQIVFMKPEDFVKVQAFLSSTIGSTMQCTLNEVLDYIHYDLGYKDVHISDVDYIWEFSPDDWVSAQSFPSIEFEYDDILDGDSMVVCQVVRTNNEPEFWYAKEVV